MEKPQIIVTYAASITDTREEAEYLALPIQISRLNLMRGHIMQGLSPQEVKDYPLTEMDKIFLENNCYPILIGTAKDVAE